MSRLDVSALRQEIAQAARRAFLQVRAAHPDEAFYAFALYTDDDAMGVSPAANTEEAYQRRVERYQSDESYMQFLKEHDIAFNPFNYRWGTPEWAYEHDGQDQFQAVSERLDAVTGSGEMTLEEYEEFKGAVLAAMLLGLKDLDAEGTFGDGPERARITLFCSLSDSATAGWFEEESARRLNPPAVYDVFLEQWSTNSVMAEHLAAHRSAPDAVYQAFRSFLDQG